MRVRACVCVCVCWECCALLLNQNGLIVSDSVFLDVPVTLWHLVALDGVFSYREDQRPTCDDSDVHCICCIVPHRACTCVYAVQRYELSIGSAGRGKSSGQCRCAKSLLVRFSACRVTAWLHGRVVFCSCSTPVSHPCVCAGPGLLSRCSLVIDCCRAGTVRSD